jgi:peptide/nickel transport system permease protein
MARLALQRLLLAILTLAAVAVVVFTITELLPGDVCTAFLGRDARNEQRMERCRQDRGLDRPAVQRFGEWAGGLLQGDLGRSVIRERPIADVIGSRLRNTFVLGIAAAAVGIPSAIGLGVLIAVRRDSAIDVAVSSTALLAMTLPDFVTASVLVFIFSFVSGGDADPGECADRRAAAQHRAADHRAHPGHGRAHHAAGAHEHDRGAGQ